jgi:hypothetical protein
VDLFDRYVPVIQGTEPKNQEALVENYAMGLRNQEMEPEI